jgi:hypothetical protein
VFRVSNKSSKVAAQAVLFVSTLDSIPKIFWIVEITEECSNSLLGKGFCKFVGLLITSPFSIQGEIASIGTLTPSLLNENPKRECESSGLGISDP